MDTMRKRVQRYMLLGNCAQFQRPIFDEFAVGNSSMAARLAPALETRPDSAETSPSERELGIRIKAAGISLPRLRKACLDLRSGVAELHALRSRHHVLIVAQMNNPCRCLAAVVWRYGYYHDYLAAIEPVVGSLQIAMPGGTQPSSFDAVQPDQHPYCRPRVPEYPSYHAVTFKCQSLCRASSWRNCPAVLDVRPHRVISWERRRPNRSRRIELHTMQHKATREYQSARLLGVFPAAIYEDTASGRWELLPWSFACSACNTSSVSRLGMDDTAPLYDAAPRRRL
ncbi:hypothetical protein TgHK011_006233 [Trichoderma gracile]|nr:hypothetical protein TgHK011_006233 [Trichoderma gracile]